MYLQKNFGDKYRPFIDDKIKLEYFKINDSIHKNYKRHRNMHTL